jgi:hypothetical protein
MPPEPSVVCPSCGAPIPLTEALTGRIRDDLRRQLTEEQAARERTLREEYDRLLAAGRKEADEAARKATTVEMQALKERVAETDAALAKAQQAELEMRRRERELEARAKTLELEVERKMAEQRRAIELETAARMAEDHRLKDAEKDRIMADLKSRLEDANRRAEQGSQQSQGETLEIELETMLRSAFPQDLVEPVAKGVRGADVLQTVRDGQARDCGVLAWEFKNTKAWNDAWLDKLKDDQRAIKADLAVIATSVLPKGVDGFGLVKGVWVTDLATAPALAAVLRFHLLHLATARASAEGRAEKMELLYAYLTGKEFRQRVEAFVEAFRTMKEDLERERRATEGLWAKREKQIQRALLAVAGLYGDIQGISGSSLPRVEMLELPPPADPEIT